MEKINIAEILKDCPSGMELDCALFENLEFDHIDKDRKYPIICRIKTEWDRYNVHSFTEYGYYSVEKYSKCVIFPKGKTTWEGFVPPCKFKDGDIIFVKSKKGVGLISIYKNESSHLFYDHCGVSLDTRTFFLNSAQGLIQKNEINISRLATEEEKQKLFDAIKANGYKWNAEKKELEKLIEPKFKVGDRIKHRLTGDVYKVLFVLLNGYGGGVYDVAVTNEIGKSIDIKEQDSYELVPNKFDINTLNPFDKVLARHDKDNKWCGSFFSHIDKEHHSHCYKHVTTAGKSYPYCIPYEGNQHLIGTTNDCDEYYKT